MNLSGAGNKAVSHALAPENSFVSEMSCAGRGRVVFRSGFLVVVVVDGGRRLWPRYECTTFHTEQGRKLAALACLKIDSEGKICPNYAKC